MRLTRELASSVNFIDDTIPPVREIVIVIPDLYLDPSPEDPRASPEDPWASPTDTRANAREPVPAGAPPGAGALGSMPGFEHAARFGTRRSIASDGGWRPWLTRWLGRPDVAPYAPATVVAAALSSPTRATATAWLATPVHLIAGLTNLHLDRRGLLRLPAEDLASCAQDFNRTFGDPDLHLEPLPNGEFLLRGPADWNAVTTEPARALVTDLGSSLPRGNAATALKRLGAELEMWLHSHPLNDARRRRGEIPVSTLWLWGGGSLESLKSARAPLTDLACGTDPYLAGLWHLQGAPTRAVPDRFGDLLSDSKSERATLVLEITPRLQANPNWTVFEALVDLDRLYLSPALAALGARALETVLLVVNDMEVRLRRGDRLKFWRRSRPGIAALQSA
jgi:hypothetical protein